MFDAPQELIARIRLGEDNTLELKSVRLDGIKVRGPQRDDLADELAAMANTCDGVCVLGVDDKSRQILGIPFDALDEVERFVRDLCSDCVRPPLRVLIRREELPDASGAPRLVLKVDVPRSLFVHESPGGYLHRIGSSKRRLPPDLLARLFQQRSQARIIRFDEACVPETTLADLEPELWRRFAAGREDPVGTLHKRKLLAMDEGTQRPTVAGVLLCALHPEQWLPGASARAVRFRGTRQDSNDQVDAADITGPLDRQIEELYSFALRNTRRAVRPGPPAREVPQFSHRALFEAIVNAIAHRDYSVHGSRVRLLMFDDRLELYSPGALPNTLTVDSLALRQSTRNESVKSILVKLPVSEVATGTGRGFYMEAQGDGVPVIVSETLSLVGREPVWRVIDESEVLLTIPAATLD